jgi:hypothetical protein
MVGKRRPVARTKVAPATTEVDKERYERVEE